MNEHKQAIDIYFADIYSAEEIIKRLVSAHPELFIELSGVPVPSRFHDLTFSDRVEVDRFLNCGQNVNAIKLVRSITHLGLKDAKAITDQRKRELNL